MSCESPFLYPGRGLQLREATSANVVSNPTDVAIADSGYSEGWGGHDCLEFSLEVGCAAGNATGDVLVEYGDDWSFTNVITHATITLNTKRIANYKSGGPLTGFFRVKNTSGQTLSVRLQKRLK